VNHYFTLKELDSSENVALISQLGKELGEGKLIIKEI